MKTVTVQHAQANLLKLLRRVAAGEEVRLVQRNKPVAKIVPLPDSLRQVDWSHVRSRLRSLWGDKPAPGKPASQIIRDGRR